MRRREWDTKLYDIAEAQLGYFSTAQARDAGINPIRLLQLVKSEDIERASRGVYRLTRFPISPLGQYMEATLWPQVRRPDMWAVLSHESALSLYDLSDASPSKVHITLPPPCASDGRCPGISRSTAPHSRRGMCGSWRAFGSRRRSVPSMTSTRTISAVRSCARRSVTDGARGT